MYLFYNSENREILEKTTRFSLKFFEHKMNKKHVLINEKIRN